MLVLGDKEDRRNDCGGWRDWAVGSDGIELSSAGVVKWLRNDLVRVLVRPATGVCSAEVAASFGDVQSSALRELMHYLLANTAQQGHLRWYARNVCASGEDLALVLIGLHLGLMPNTTMARRTFFHVFGESSGADTSAESIFTAAASLTERLATKDMRVRSERVRMALLSLPPSRLVKLAAAVEGRGTPTRTALVPRGSNVHSLSLERRAWQHGSGWKRGVDGHSTRRVSVRRDRPCTPSRRRSRTPPAERLDSWRMSGRGEHPDGATADPRESADWHLRGRDDRDFVEYETDTLWGDTKVASYQELCDAPPVAKLDFAAIGAAMDRWGALLPSTRPLRTAATEFVPGAVGRKLNATLSPSEPCATKLTLDASNGALRRLACSDGTVRHFEGGSDGAPLIETTPLATQPPLSPPAVARQPGFSHRELCAARVKLDFGAEPLASEPLQEDTSGDAVAEGRSAPRSCSPVSTLDLDVASLVSSAPFEQQLGGALDMSAAAAAAEQGVEHQASDALEALMATWLGEEKALPNGASELELKASIKLLQAQRAAAVGKAELARIDGELGARFEQLRARRGLQLLESGRIWECIGTKVHRDEGERGGRGGNEGRASHAGGDDSGEGEGEGAGVGGGEAIVEGE